MKRVKYLPEVIDRGVSGVTYGKIYDVLRYHKEKDGIYDSVLIKNDKGVIEIYYLNSYYDTKLFIDATSEYRDKIIDDILS